MLLRIFVILLECGLRMRSLFGIFLRIFSMVIFEFMIGIMVLVRGGIWWIFFVLNLLWLSGLFFELYLFNG